MPLSEPLVSIIIPVYNRQDILSYTLDSIVNQTYTNWECIIVDDGSTDGTLDILNKYCVRDDRFELRTRPCTRRKGGNAARNIGFENTKGVYVNWFDSDDIMNPNFIKFKINALMADPNLDFVVSKCINFYPDDSIEEIQYYSNNNSYDLNLNNFIQEKVHWVTPDILIRKTSIGNLRFNEELDTGQEYNFFINLLASKNLNGKFINLFLCKRRIHEHSKQAKLKSNPYMGFKNKFFVGLITFQEVYDEMNTKSKKIMINRLLILANNILSLKKIPRSYTKFVLIYFKTCGLYKTIFLILNTIFLLFGKKSYFLKQKVTLS